LPAHLRTRLKEAPSSFRATRDVMLSASHVAATTLLHQHIYHLPPHQTLIIFCLFASVVNRKNTTSKFRFINVKET